VVKDMPILPAPIIERDRIDVEKHDPSWQYFPLSRSNPMGHATGDRAASA
jgi:hypothetical protein